MGNTIGGTLLTAFLADRAVTKLGNVFAPFSALGRDFGTDPYKPLAVVEVKKVTGGATVQTNPSDFENGDSIVAPVSVTMAQKSVSFAVSNADMSGGLRLENLIDASLQNFSDAVWDVVAALCTTGNFTLGLTSAPAAFGFSDLQTLYGLLKKAPSRALLIDGGHLAGVLNLPSYAQVVGQGPGAWRTFGWDNGVHNVTRWSAAGADVVGFATSPNAIVVCTGLPLMPVNAIGLDRKVFEVPGIGLSVAAHTWFSLKTRSAWASFDLMIGAAVADGTAGFLVKSA